MIRFEKGQFCFFNGIETHLHSSKVTWQWKITIFNREYIFKRSIFHCHVSLPEGKTPGKLMAVTPILLGFSMGPCRPSYHWKGRSWDLQKTKELSVGISMCFLFFLNFAVKRWKPGNTMLKTRGIQGRLVWRICNMQLQNYPIYQICLTFLDPKYSAKSYTRVEESKHLLLVPWFSASNPWVLMFDPCMRAHLLTPLGCFWDVLTPLFGDVLRYGYFQK